MRWASQEDAREEGEEVNTPLPQPVPEDVVTYVKSKKGVKKYVNGKKVPNE